MSSNIIVIYYRAYGGFSAFIKSPYLYLSLFLTIALYPHWSGNSWWEDVLSIMPNLLGFSLGGYAMFLAIGDEKFRGFLAGKEEDEDDDVQSPFLALNGAFVHFIIFQVLALFFALFRKAYDFPISEDNPMIGFFGDSLSCLVGFGNFIGYWVFVYALVLSLAATFALLRVGNWYDIYQTDLKASENEDIDEEGK